MEEVGVMAELVLMAFYCMLGVGVVSNFDHNPLHKVLGVFVAVGWVVGGLVLLAWCRWML